jgi:hypothetical protein
MGLPDPSLSGRQQAALARVAADFCGFEGPADQVMRWDDRPGQGGAFWGWHLRDRPQWYWTPEEACAAYVASYVEWIEEHLEEP